MAYTLIKGEFYIVGYSPDGDSIKFKANNPKNWDRLITEHREVFEEKLAEDNGIITLRLQGVDALETHYSPPSPLPPQDVRGKSSKTLNRPDAGGHKQPAELGEEATNAFLEMLGVSGVEWQSWGKNTWIDKAYLKKGRRDVLVGQKYQDRIPGHIVTDDVEKNGRPIAWVFPGSTSARDGSNITVASLARRLKNSANYRLLEMGLVYPYFFMTLPARLRDKLVEACQVALADAKERRRKNLWHVDKTTGGLGITNLHSITYKYEMYPYLFRKILKHWHRKNLEQYWDALRTGIDYDQNESRKRVDLEGFFEGGNPYLFVISDQDFVRLDSVLTIKNGRLKMKKYPFDIVFLS